jgi:hypothetical protein
VVVETEELVTAAVNATGIPGERMYWTELTRIEYITIQLYGFEESVRIEVWDSAPNQPLLLEETTMSTPCPCDLARDCHAAYLAAEPHLRRLFNQAFFTHLYIDDDGVRHDYAEPFDTLLGDDVLDAGRAIQADPGAGQITMADLLGGPATSTNSKTPRALCAAGGLAVGPSAPVYGVEGSNRSSLVPLAGLESAA